MVRFFLITLIVACISPGPRARSSALQETDQDSLIAMNNDRSGQSPLPEPKLKKLPASTYGDSEYVLTFARLLDSKDSLVRLQAVFALGQTHNRQALQYVTKALTDDKNTSVRAAATLAANGFGDADFDGLMKIALFDKDANVVSTAMRCIRRRGRANLAPDIIALLKTDDATVILGAIVTLTALDVPASYKTLADLLETNNKSIKLAAMQNALLKATVKCPISNDQLDRLVRQSPPLIRASALALAGKFAYRKFKKLIEKASTDSNPIIRCGAVKAWGFAGKGEKILPLLSKSQSDPCGYLEAIKAAGVLKFTGPEKEIVKALQSAKSDVSEAAEEALKSIASPAAAQSVGELLSSILTKYRITPRGNPERARQKKHAIACCKILASMRSDAAIEAQLASLKWMLHDDRLTAELCMSLKEIDPKRATPEITALLKRSIPIAKKLFLILASGREVNSLPAFNEDVVAVIVESLGDMKATSSIKVITELMNLNVGQMSCGYSGGIGARALG
ncbi:MAG TPA: HEAT repeat domain-containing protein, partial [Phycisphaerae bacterium]|nr:HEAT repeat domain-containing protein [Phycisphaerae bacterium]